MSSSSSEVSSESLRQKPAQVGCSSDFAKTARRMKFPLKGFFSVFVPVQIYYEKFFFCRGDFAFITYL